MQGKTFFFLLFTHFLNIPYSQIDLRPEDPAHVPLKLDQTNKMFGSSLFWTFNFVVQNIWVEMEISSTLWKYSYMVLIFDLSII